MDRSPKSNVSVVDLLPCGLVSLSLNGTFLTVNRHFLELTQQSRGALVGQSFSSVLSASSRFIYETEIMAALLLRGRVQEVSLDLRQALGGRTPVLVNADLEFDEQGQAQQLHLAIFGATQHRAYERELLKKTAVSDRLGELVRRASDAILMLTADGIISLWNEGAETIFGISSATAVGRSFMEVVRPEIDFEEYGKIVERLSSGSSVGLETTALHSRGHSIAISLSFTPEIVPPGVFASFSAVIRDVTARKLSEKALVQSEKLASVGRLASSIAHEINNPLEAVTNLLYLLTYQTTEPEALRTVHLAQEELARVSEITTHTLRFHKQSSDRTNLSLDGLFESVLLLYRGRLAGKNIHVRTDRARASTLHCFEGELRQILANLVANAFDAMDQEGTLTLRHRPATAWPSHQKGVRITVADNGSGMDLQTTAHIFEPFFTTKGMEGTGLGLWITQELTRRNGGTVRLRSRRGHGTVFSLFFPEM